MGSFRQPRYTIGQFMALIAALACAFSVPRLVRSARFMTSGESTLLTCVAALPLLLVVTNFLLELALGIQCPACSHWGLKRLARHRRHYQCPACGVRVKRSGFGPWRDASGPDEAANYRRHNVPKPWAGFSVPAEPGDTTSGQLLRNQRMRRPPEGEANRNEVLDPDPRAPAPAHD